MFHVEELFALSLPDLWVAFYFQKQIFLVILLCTCDLILQSKCACYFLLRMIYLGISRVVNRSLKFDTFKCHIASALELNLNLLQDKRDIVCAKLKIKMYMLFRNINSTFKKTKYRNILDIIGDSNGNKTNIINPERVLKLIVENLFPFHLTSQRCIEFHQMIN